jgi:hypothetical protein
MDGRKPVFLGPMRYVIERMYDLTNSRAEVSDIGDGWYLGIIRCAYTAKVENAFMFRMPKL